MEKDIFNKKPLRGIHAIGGLTLSVIQTISAWPKMRLSIFDHSMSLEKFSKCNQLKLLCICIILLGNFIILFLYYFISDIVCP